MQTPTQNDSQQVTQSGLSVTDWLAELPPQPLLGTYLAAHVKSGIIDFHIRAEMTTDGAVKFYIHPAHQSGRTEDYVTKPNRPEVDSVRGLLAILDACKLG